MDRIEPTRRIALTVWWALVWRYFIGLLLVGLLQSLVLVLLASMLQLTPAGADNVSRALFFLLALPLLFLVSWELVYRILRKRFAGFRIVLVKPEPEDQHLVEL
ncbi:MAG: hypothetical protein WC728_10655 [Elusimicrobiota bacterium]